MASPREFRLPDIGEGVTEGEIVEWFVKEGDVVSEDDPMVEVMTDKATVTIGAPCAGRVETLCFDVGAVARVGQVILTIAPSGTSSVRSRPRSSRPAATAVGDIQDSVPGARLFQQADIPVAVENGDAHGGNGGGSNGNGHGAGHGSVRPAAAAQRRVVQTSETASPHIAYFEAKPLATPATRRLAKEMGVDLRRVQPTGQGGRVTRDDVRSAVRDHMTEDRPHTQLEERAPIVGMRRKIAERMQYAKATAAHFTFVEECDVGRLMELRAGLKPEAERRGVRLNYLPFVVKAVIDALRKHPVLNSAMDERTNELVYKKYYNIGIATATDAGLMVPVVSAWRR